MTTKQERLDDAVASARSVEEVFDLLMEHRDTERAIGKYPSEAMDVSLMLNEEVDKPVLLCL